MTRVRVAALATKEEGGRRIDRGGSRGGRRGLIHGTTQQLYYH